MIIPAIVFDIGGTLIHPDFGVLRKWTVDKIDDDVSTKTVERAFRLAIAGDVFSAPGSEIQTQATRFFSSCGCTHTLNRHWIEWWTEIVDSGGVDSWLYKVLDTEAVATLLRLRELGCHLIAASNSDGTLQAELRVFNLLELFDKVYDSSVLGVSKPSLAFYEHVMANAQSEAFVHVGDDLIKDVIAASAAGFHKAFLFDPVGIYSGVPSHVRIPHLSEIPSALGIE